MLSALARLIQQLSRASIALVLGLALMLTA